MADEIEGATEEAQGEPKVANEPLTMDAVKKMIQSETDRVRTEYVRKLKEVEAEKDGLVKERMSEKERAAYELEQREKLIAQKDMEIRAREVDIEKSRVMSELEIPREFADYITGNDGNEIALKATKFMDVFSEAVAREANRKLAGSMNKPVVGETKGGVSRAQLDDLTEWRKIWAMPRGPEKDKLMAERIAAAGNLNAE